jgi:hypothetical protein
MLTIIPYNGGRELLELPTGILVKANSKKLIKEVKLAPLANESFKKLIELKLKDSQIVAEVKYSAI